MSLRSACLIDEAFFGKKTVHLVLGLLSSSAGLSDFHIIRCQISRILLYMVYYATKKGTCWGFVYKTRCNIYVTLYIITHILVHIYNKDMVTTSLTIQNCK